MVRLPTPPEVVYYAEKNMVWNPPKFEILGITFTNDLKDITDMNLTGKIDKIAEEIKRWKKRKLTPLGRVAVIKSLLLSQIVHILISLPEPSCAVKTKLQNMFFSFLWEDKPDRIKRKVTYQKIEHGGLGMPDINTFIKSLKVTWIRRLITNTNNTWTLLLSKQIKYTNILQHLGPDVFLHNAEIRKSNVFWNEVILSFKDFANSIKILNKDQFLNCPILFNDKLTIGNKVISNNQLLIREVFFIKHFYSDSDQVHTYHDFKNKYNVDIDFVTFKGIVTAISKYRRHLLTSWGDNDNTTLNNDQNQEGNLVFKLLLNDKRGSSKIYQCMINPKQIPTGMKKWEGKLNEELPWEMFLKHMKLITKDMKLIWFQLRIFHHILTTNRSVSKFNPNQDEYCTFCRTETETIDHVLWECNYTKRFINETMEFLTLNCPCLSNVKLEKNTFLFGFSNPPHVGELFFIILLLSKFFIYRCKVNQIKPSLTTFKSEIRQLYLIEESIFGGKNHYEKFKVRWAQFVKLLD